MPPHFGQAFVPLPNLFIRLQSVIASSRVWFYTTAPARSLAPWQGHLVDEEAGDKNLVTITACAWRARSSLMERTRTVRPGVPAGSRFVEGEVLADAHDGRIRRGVDVISGATDVPVRPT